MGIQTGACPANRLHHQPEFVNEMKGDSTPENFNVNCFDTVATIILRVYSFFEQTVSF